MDAVARAAGVSKPVVYDCFASKAELFGALLDREEQRMLAGFGAALAAGTRSEDLRGTLKVGFTSMLRAVTEAPRAYRIALLGGGDANAVIEARVRHGRDRQIAAIAEVARTWLEGGIPAEGLDMAAQFVGQTLVSIGEAGVRLLLLEPDQWAPETLGAALGAFAAAGYSSFFGSSSTPRSLFGLVEP